jgi:hypothetical protein
LIKSDHDLGVADDDGGEGHDKLSDIGEGSIDQLWKSLPSFLTVGDLGHGVSHKLHEEGVAGSMDFVIANFRKHLFKLREGDEDSNHVQPCYDEDSPGKAGVGAEGMHHCSVPR